MESKPKVRRHLICGIETSKCKIRGPRWNGFQVTPMSQSPARHPYTDSSRGLQTDDWWIKRGCQMVIFRPWLKCSASLAPESGGPVSCSAEHQRPQGALKGQSTPSPGESQVKLLLCLPGWLGHKAAGRNGEFGGGNLHLLQVVFYQHRIEFGDLFPRVLPGSPGTVQVSAVFLPGGDLGGGGRHIEADLHHADHGVECVVQFEERLQRLGIGRLTPTRPAASETGRHAAANFGETGLECFGLHGHIGGQVALDQGYELILHRIHFLMACEAMLHPL